MTAIVILNAVLAAFVVVGILSLLGWAILTDRGTILRLPRSENASRGAAGAPAQRRQAAVS